jgi:hypothetical protein
MGAESSGNWVAMQQLSRRDTKTGGIARTRQDAQMGNEDRAQEKNQPCTQRLSAVVPEMGIKRHDSQERLVWLRRPARGAEDRGADCHKGPKGCVERSPGIRRDSLVDAARRSHRKERQEAA